MDISSLILQVCFVIIGAYVSVLIGKFLRQNGRILDRIDEGLTKIDERMDEGFRRIDEGFRRMDEGLKLIARLIVEENERTRKEILKALRE